MSTDLTRREIFGLAGKGVLASSAAAAFVAPAFSSKEPDRIVPVVVDGCSPNLPSQDYFDRMRIGGVDCWHVSMLPSLAYFSELLTILNDLSHIAEIARSSADIRRIKREGKISVTFGWQDAGPLADPADNDWAVKPPKTVLRLYYELGLRVVGLAYNLANEFGGGCLDPHIGLTKAGTQLLNDMQKIGILVDVGGHTAEQTSLDVIARAERPVVCTHSNVLALNNNPRNTSDRVIEGIAGTGGLFAVSAIDPFMSWGVEDVGVRTQPKRRANVKRYVDELDYLKRLVGVEHVGIGGDFAAYKGIIDPSDSFRFTPEMTYLQNPIQYVKGFGDISELPNVHQEMKRRGWKASEINAVMGENWMRVYANAW